MTYNPKNLNDSVFKKILDGITDQNMRMVFTCGYIRCRDFAFVHKDDLDLEKIEERAKEFLKLVS